MSSAFFYGTLMAPDVLRRVIGNDGTHLQVAPAILLEHTRHHIKGEDYPAVIPYARASLLFEHELSREERSVRGTLVHGLTDQDIARLDVFEGDEYRREQVSVHKLAPPEPLPAQSTGQLLAHSDPIPANLPAPDKSMVYIWSSRITRLEPRLWSFDTFVDEKLHRWIDGDPESNEQAEIDRRRDMNGIIVPSEEQPVPAIIERYGDIPSFGHPMLKYFNFAPTYINLNHGSYGSTPKPVLRVTEQWTLEAETRPDKWMRRTYIPILNTARARVAELINAETDECVIVQNAMHAINTVLYNIDFNPGDILVGFSTTYESVSSTLRFLADRPPNPSISTIKLNFPTTHAAILKQFREHLQSLPRHEGQKVVAIVDGIISAPGTLLPWEDMVSICKEEKVWSLVDAAHCIGQIPIDLATAQPDFWISNCHKWLLSKRGSAVLYVPKRNQHLIKTTFPTSDAYRSPDSPEFPGNFVAQFEWTGTIDFVPYLSIIPALDFRQAIGGEKKIRDYCHFLALAGGRAMADVLGTKVLDDTPTGELTANMTDVLLPLPIGQNQTSSELRATLRKIQDGLLQHDCYVAIYVRDRQWWARASAQIWLEVSDFERVAQVLLKLSLELGGSPQ